MVHNQQSNLAPSLRPKICSPAACMRLLYVWGRPWPPARGPLLLPTMEGKGPMMALISGYNFVNHVIRSCVPPLIPFIVNEFSFNGSQQALLMSAFFQGYLVTQIPGGWLAQKVGGKVVAQLNLCGNACLLLLPTAAKYGANSLAACLCVIGVCQGPLVPTVSILQRNWLPTGPM